MALHVAYARHGSPLRLLCDTQDLEEDAKALKRQRSQKSAVDEEETDLTGGIHQVPPL